MSKKLKMIDLFAGIFGDDTPFEGDITNVKSEDIPDHDILFVGFSCQPFSLAGVDKKNSMKRKTVFWIKHKELYFLKLQEFLKIRDLNVLCSKMSKIYNIL